MDLVGEIVTAESMVTKDPEMKKFWALKALKNSPEGSISLPVGSACRT